MERTDVEMKWTELLDSDAGAAGPQETYGGMPLPVQSIARFMPGYWRWGSGE